MLSETWLDNDEHASIPNFDCCVQFKRPGQRAAGVVREIYRKQNNSHVVTPHMDITYRQTSELEMLCDALIPSFYQSPNSQLHKILWVAVSSAVGFHVECRRYLQIVCLQDVVSVDQTDESKCSYDSFKFLGQLQGDSTCVHFSEIQTIMQYAVCEAMRTSYCHCDAVNCYFSISPNKFFHLFPSSRNQNWTAASIFINNFGTPFRKFLYLLCIVHSSP
ncbi:hypothetical protein TNIN_237741 [Trichonephila inaurata madagascariensis]|uniref:Uncharacterized protein n=1 Tax=Trichonephila inaurata madagascariensis TaxID=2747483 RepID=A0A8X6MHS5_9ARAC|nr:hypothetical protein TNIN_237741 [Trichonephila inaurata madagascariensis]